MTAFRTAAATERILRAQAATLRPRLPRLAASRRRVVSEWPAERGEQIDREPEERVIRMVDDWLYNEQRTRELTPAEEMLVYLLMRQAIQPLTPAIVLGCAGEFARVSKDIQ